MEDGPGEVRASKTAWKGMVMLTTGRIPKKLGELKMLIYQADSKNSNSATLSH